MIYVHIISLKIALDIFEKFMYNFNHAAVVKLVDTRDLKSLGSDTVPVQVRSAAPNGIPENNVPTLFSGFLFCKNGFVRYLSVVFVLSVKVTH